MGKFRVLEGTRENLCIAFERTAKSAPVNAYSLDDLAPVIGYRAVRIVAAWFAGRRLHVPVSANPAHPLAKLIGRPAFDALVREFPGDRFSVPTNREDENYRRDRQIAEWLAAGRPLPEIAECLCLTVRRVEQIRVELVDLGWLEYAAGFSTAMAHRRARRASIELPRLVDFSGPSEVSGDLPPPSRPVALADGCGSGCLD